MTHRQLDTRPQRTPGQIVAIVVAALAMLFLGWLFLASGLFMPLWAIAGLFVIWAVLLWPGVRLARQGSYLVLVVPLVGAVIWLLTTWIGDDFLHWTP